MAVVVNARGGAARPVFRRRASRSGWLGVAAVTPVALLILAVAVHCLDLLFSGQHRSDVIRLFSDATYYQILLNTAVYSLFATTIAMLVGVPIAWFSERIARSGARWIRVAMIAGTVVPGFFVAMGWLLLGHSRIGFFANLGIPINITSLGGLAFAQGLALASLVFVMIAPSMAALSQSLEESAAIHGMNRVAIWRHVLLPLLKPALIACGSDQAEAMALADRIAVMADAQVRQVGTPREIYSRPAHPALPRSWVMSIGFRGGSKAVACVRISGCCRWRARDCPPARPRRGSGPRIYSCFLAQSKARPVHGSSRTSRVGCGAAGAGRAMKAPC